MEKNQIHHLPPLLEVCYHDEKLQIKLGKVINYHLLSRCWLCKAFTVTLWALSR